MDSQEKREEQTMPAAIMVFDSDIERYSFRFVRKRCGIVWREEAEQQEEEVCRTQPEREHIYPD
jgi:hypothetical protein